VDYGHALKMANTPTQKPALVQQPGSGMAAYAPTATDEFFTSDSRFDFDYSQGMTVCLWFNVPDLTLYQDPIRRYDAGTATGYLARINSAGGRWDFITFNGGSQAALAANSGTDQWFFGCGVKAPDAQTAFLDGEAGTPNTSAPALLSEGTPELRVMDTNFVGALDSLWIWNFALNPGQIEMFFADGEGHWGVR
jgi:hypothetical protein